MQKLVSQLSTQLISKQLKVVTVESCTAGWIGKTLTDQAGSSEWFAGGLITYTNESKHHLAQVPVKTIEQYGAVSTQVVEAMARGGLNSFKDCISVAVSGVAGPGGGTENKPVGHVCIATCYHQNTVSKGFYFDGDRNQVRQQTVEQALLMLIDCVK